MMYGIWGFNTFLIQTVGEHDSELKSLVRQRLQIDR